MREELLDNVFLTYVPSRKFKTALLSAQIVSPLSRETAGRNALLVNVLSRGTVDYPDLTALNARLDQLYGAQIEPTVRKMGENQVFGFQATCVEERFLPSRSGCWSRWRTCWGSFSATPPPATAVWWGTTSSGSGRTCRT